MSGYPESMLLSMAGVLRARAAALITRCPRLPMAAKAAVAATLAWLVVLPFGGAADKYAYFAPLGAVVAVSSTLVSSVRESLQSIGAILLGALLASCAGATPLPEAVSLALVVGLGVVMAGWARLGSAGSWVPIAALFVLIIGGHNRDLYVLAYIGLTSVGAGIGIAVNAMLPPLPLSSAAEAVGVLRRALADQLEDLAEGLEQEVPPTASEWNERQWWVGNRTQEMRDMVLMANEARSANWRARRRRSQTEHQRDQARALQRLSLVVEDLTLLVVERERGDLEEVALGPRLRSRSAHAFRAVADLLRAGVDADEDSALEAQSAVTELARSIEDLRQTGEELNAAGAVVTALRQVLASLGPSRSEQMTRSTRR